MLTGEIEKGLCYSYNVWDCCPFDLLLPIFLLVIGIVNNLRDISDLFSQRFCLVNLGLYKLLNLY